MEGLIRMFIGCLREGKVPKEAWSECIVHQCKDKGNPFENVNYKGFSLLCMVGKILGLIVVERRA